MVLENIQPRGEPVRSCGWGYIADLANYETDLCVCGYTLHVKNCTQTLVEIDSMFY